MKTLKRNSYRIYLMVGLFCAVTLYSCEDKCQVTNTYVYYEPVYTSPAEIKASIGMKDEQPLVALGRIYLKGNILFVNEAGKGIHLFNNAQPSAPQSLGFFNIPGNYDLAIIGNTLYADSYVDLIAFDISDIQNIREVSRISNLFNHSSSMGFTASGDKGILTDWKMMKTVTVTESNCKQQVQPWGRVFMQDGIGLLAGAATTFNTKAAVAPSNSTGIGGSMARFTIANNYLYALDNYSMDIVDVAEQFQPKAKNEIQVNWLAETLFPNGNTLFMGTRSGMNIYDLTDPAQPSLISQYQHITSCDPVVVEGDYAYVTLRGGTPCQSFTNQLEVINIKDLKKPLLEKVYPMVNPYGLGIDKGTLFVCDGDAGLKIFDAKDIYRITENPLAHYDKINAFDVIPYKNVAIMIGSDGLYQYDYTDVKKIKLLSKIPITKP